MKPNTLLFIGFLFFDVAALAWGAWELWSARAEKTDKANPMATEAPKIAASPELSGHPEG
jgi:hypothetical protein